MIQSLNIDWSKIALSLVCRSTTYSWNYFLSTFLCFDANAFSTSTVLCWYVVLSNIDMQMRWETYLGRVCFGFPLVLSTVSSFWYTCVTQATYLPICHNHFLISLRFRLREGGGLALGLTWKTGSLSGGRGQRVRWGSRPNSWRWRWGVVWWGSALVGGRGGGERRANGDVYYLRWSALRPPTQKEKKKKERLTISPVETGVNEKCMLELGWGETVNL
jgi:hypothetical protein